MAEERSGPGGVDDPERDQAKRPGEVFAEEVKAAMKRKGWTQKDLADALKKTGARVDRTTVSKITSGGRTNITIDEVLSFALALGVPPLSLIVPRSHKHLRIADTHVADASIALTWLRGRQRIPLAPDDEGQMIWSDDGYPIFPNSYVVAERFFHDSVTDHEAEVARRYPAVTALLGLANTLWELANEAVIPASFPSDNVRGAQALEEVWTEIVDLAQPELRRIKRARQSKKEKH
jgi:transcriptional regulator with XRE-family HTH domain